MLDHRHEPKAYIAKQKYPTYLALQIHIYAPPFGENTGHKGKKGSDVGTSIQSTETSSLVYKA